MRRLKMHILSQQLDYYSVYAVKCPNTAALCRCCFSADNRADIRSSTAHSAISPLNCKSATYKAEKAACDELLLKTKNAYAAVLAQAKQKQEEQARQDNRKEAKKAIFDADTLTTELADLLIERVLVYPDNRIEIAYKVKDLFE